MSNRLTSLFHRTTSKKRRSRKRASFQPPVGKRALRSHATTRIETLEERLALAAPTVIDPSASAVTPVTALLGGNLTSDGGNIVIQRGVVYSLTSVNANPTIGGPGVTVANTPPETPAGVFAVTVGALAPNSNIRSGRSRSTITAPTKRDTARSRRSARRAASSCQARRSTRAAPPTTRR